MRGTRVTEAGRVGAPPCLAGEYADGSWLGRRVSTEGPREEPPVRPAVATPAPRV
ncbi:hypothetical protein ACIBG4_05530 [Nonomuraea sp. NPDC050383]|uniref:hypothetical protein n=1 Tax=Nonomuraea sp. NPDC050383 TaxID=3364362 RepID=UPI0037A0C387